MLGAETDRLEFLVRLEYVEELSRSTWEYHRRVRGSTISELTDERGVFVREQYP
jgi:hypothetical protein